ncbi:MAM and fibronectin type III domain-containing protein 2 [Acropora cervicornis]|uniref:MAM and fibronectin type III domain-containing protein 2 n=1 Tax=Acropora cervicornis TaxID=6130 RepID=A0AAD9QJ14_ACRCE|nr:MAM and fibronectin type III domain-containing protein 2 [Acropora cervicornis]
MVDTLKNLRLIKFMDWEVYLSLSSLRIHSGYIKVWDGSGRMVFTRVGCQSNYTSSKFLETAFQYSQSITIEASLTNHQSYVRVSYGIIKDGLGAGKEYKQLLKCYTRNFYFSFKRTFISRRNAEL